jgi:hypothetical protein
MNVNVCSGVGDPSAIKWNSCHPLGPQNLVSIAIQRISFANHAAI